MSPIMFFLVVTLIMLHSVTQTLATTNAPSGTPTQAPGTPLVKSWIITMTTVAYALRSPIHSPQVAAPMN